MVDFRVHACRSLHFTIPKKKGTAPSPRVAQLYVEALLFTDVKLLSIVVYIQSNFNIKCLHLNFMVWHYM